MGRKKYTAEQKAAQKDIKQAQAAYSKALSEVKGIFKAFFSKGAGAEVEKVVQASVQELAPDITFTKAGKPTIDRKKYTDSSFVQGAAKALDRSIDFAIDAEQIFERVSSKVLTTTEKIAKESAKAYVNRRIDALRRGFGDDSAYIDIMKEDLVETGVHITGLGRIHGEVKVGELWEALKVAPKLDKEVASAIQDMTDEKIEKSEMKDRVKSAKNNESMMKTIGSYLATTKASSSQYSQTLQALYAMDPGDAYSEAGADYQDIIDSLSHPGHKLTDSELEENMRIITEYLGGLI